MPLEVVQAGEKKGSTKQKEHAEIQRQRHQAVSSEVLVQNVCAVSQGKRERKRFQSGREVDDGKEEPVEENHGKAEEIEKGLGLEDFAYRNGDKKAQEGRGEGNQEHGRNNNGPEYAGQIGQEERYAVPKSFLVEPAFPPNRQVADVGNHGWTAEGGCSQPQEGEKEPAQGWGGLGRFFLYILHGTEFFWTAEI